MLAEHFVEQPARSLDLPGAFLRCRIAAKHQPGDLGNLAKASQCHLACVEAGQHIFQQMLDGQRRWQVCGPVHGAWAEQLEPVVVDRDRHRQRLYPADAPGDQVGQPQVGHASGERVEEQVRALA
ncbi:hypothetical protein D3C71_1386210 [compost metagenome]